MYAHKRDCVPRIIDGDHCIAVAVINRSDARRQGGVDLDHVLVRTIMIDHGGAN